MYDTVTNCKLLPFYHVTDYQLEYEMGSARRHIKNLMKEKGFNTLKRNLQINMEIDLTEICDYYDVDKFNYKIKAGNFFKLFHMNIRKLGRHKAELFSYLESFDGDFDIII